MKRDEIKRAYEELEFREDLQDRYFRNITSRGLERKKDKRFRLAPVLLCVLLAGTTIYAAEKLDLLGWYYGEGAKILRDATEDAVFTAQNGHLKMSVEDAVFTEGIGTVFVHVEALDEEGMQFMRQNGSSLSVELSMEKDGETAMDGSSVASQFCGEISDEENWYYRIQTVNHSAAEDGGGYQTAEVSFWDAKSEEADVPDSLQNLAVEFPVSQALKEGRNYTECGEFRKVSLSPLSVTVSWDTMLTADGSMKRLEELEIKKSDGSVLRLEYVFGNGYEMNGEWESVFMTESGGDGLTTLTAVPKGILIPEEIETVKVNGTVCK